MNTMIKPRETYLANGTQHNQKGQPWETVGFGFHVPAYVPYTAFDPNRGTQRQCVEAWRNLLGHIDNLLDADLPVDGVLLGGYAPAVLALYQFLSNQRTRCYVAVMDAAPMVEGERRQFVLGGARLIPTPRTLRAQAPVEGQPLAPEDELTELLPARKALAMIPRDEIDVSKLIHVSARPLTPARRDELKSVVSHTLIGTAPVLPPPSSSDMEDFKAGIATLAETAHEAKCGVLLDGPPAETMLHLFSYLHGTELPFYFLKTEVKEAGKPAVPVAMELVPRF